MAPKAKPKAKAGAAAKAKVKAKAKARGRALRARGALAKVAARAKAKVGHPRPPRRGLRRPAAAGGPPSGGASLKQLWDTGHSVRCQDLSMDWLMDRPMIVFEEALYFHAEARVAGKFLGALNDEGRRVVRIQPQGTLSEALLKVCAGQPGLALRVHLCDNLCNQEETAEDLLHGKRVRKMKGDKEEDPWTSNLLGVKDDQPPDELAQLRKAYEDLTKERDQAKEEAKKAVKKTKKKEKKEKPRSSKLKGKEKKEGSKKEASEKKGKRKGKRSSTEEEESSGGVPLDGTRPRRAAIKTREALFSGKGMDPEKVRSRVIRAARRFARKKGKRKSSSSGSSKTSSDDGELEGDEALFSESTRVRGLAESFPGALAFRALSAMQDHLLQGVGLEDSKGPASSTAVQYCRQVLAKKASGASGRELLTLAAAIDLVARAKPSRALDLLIQRFKSVENTVSGMAWQISQRMELLPSETASLSELREVKDARRELAEESKVRYGGTPGDGKGYGGRGQGKGKQNSKDDGKRWDRYIVL